MAELLEHSRRLSGECVEIGERFFTACINLRGRASDPRFVRAVTSVTDVAPPTQACASVSSLFGSLLWLGPDEWLVVSESQPGEEIAVRLRQALQAIPAAVTDVSDARSVFTLTGANARYVLAKGCSIDFHPRAFLRGQCVQSLLAKASVLIHARATETFDVYVARSFADYAWAWFENAHAQYR